MKLGFVFTNFNNSHFTRAAVRSIMNSPAVTECAVVIVDNKSEAEDVRQLQDIKLDYPSIHLVLNDENLGYFRGLNVGLDFLRELHTNIEFFIVGNNDLVFPDCFIESLLERKASLHEHAVISPDLVTLDGVHQNPHVVGEISKFRRIVWDLYYANYGVAMAISYAANFFRRFVERKDYQQHKVAQNISEGYGACYILTPLFFQNFRCLWAPTFLMGEEFFLRKQLLSKGMKVYYEPAILVNHHDHATLSKLPGKKLWEIAHDSHKIYRKYADDRAAENNSDIARECWKS